ncbi:MAG: LLM class flavin-dependent oxidoreductase [Bacteroidetes bacterium]|nr:LLM class flavin-dependent oxidoreductase [Bacteroidota bacterium]MDA0922842.1 LLM class flavin-dependent oxidoreductase [Bacteroidota bacterium]MDA1288963.1 LLM class flavin-dependent oxidoreductase [Bacteroidota bacterium]
MEIGVDSFAAVDITQGVPSTKDRVKALSELIDRIVYADQVGLDFFGIGEHHREEFLDSAPHMILAAAAAKTKNIRLGSAVAILSAADPVRVFQNYSTLDLLSSGRAEMVVGRGSFSESFPLFGYEFEDYDALFIEKLELLLKIQEEEIINWSGRFRAPLQNQRITPRPYQEKIPVWLGVGGTPASFVRAGSLGLPLMIAIIGGETHRFKPLVDLYRRAGEQAGFSPEELKVGIHSLGYVAETKDQAIEEYYPGYAYNFTRIGKERGWPPVTFERFAAQNGRTGALLVGDPEEIAEKILGHSAALGGIQRLTFQLDNANLTHNQLKKTMQLIAEKVKPIINQP